MKILKKNNLITKYVSLSFFFIIICYLISVYFVANREFFNIPSFNDKYFIIPKNKEGKIVHFQDKKSLNNIDNQIQDYEFNNINKLQFTIQLYSNNNLEKINTYLTNLLKNKKEIIDEEDIFVFHKQTEIGTQYFITYKNLISKNKAFELCELLTIVERCIILNLQN